MNGVARTSVALNGVARTSVALNGVARTSVARSGVARSSVAQRLCLLSVTLATLVFTSVAMAQLPACPEEQATALSLLERMSRASTELDYRGVVTVQRGDEMQVVQVSHFVSDGASSESITRLTGQGARVSRKDHPLDCVHPGSQLLQLGQALARGDCGLARHYRFKVSEGDRVAGRQAVRLKVDPRDVYRFGYVMDLDQDTGLLLKIRYVGHGDDTLEKSQFANLSFSRGETGDSDIEVEHQARHPQPPAAHGDHPAPMSSLVWRVNWVPEGFVATDSAAPGQARRTYTDGLAAFSVFLEELPREIRPGEGMVRRGATTSYSRGLRLGERPVLVTVIGEVPVNTARMVADSIAWEVAHAD